MHERHSLCPSTVFGRPTPNPFNDHLHENAENRVPEYCLLRVHLPLCIRIAVRLRIDRSGFVTRLPTCPGDLLLRKALTFFNHVM